MAKLVLNLSLMAALGLLLCHAGPVSDTVVVIVTSPISVPFGHTTTLPCWLSPPQSAEALEIRWYKGDNFDSPVLLYRAKKLEDASQDPSYRGRVSFGLKDAASGGLKAGDVSLKLENVTLQDAGDYKCYVSSDRGYDSASVRLAVKKTGSSPLLSSEWTDGNMVNVSCDSRGWYPEPELQWLEKKQVKPSKNTNIRVDSSGLKAVHSWLLVPTSTEVTCSVGLSGDEPKEARVRLGDPPPAESVSSPGGWVAFGLLLVATLALLGFLYYKLKVRKTKPGSDVTDGNVKCGKLEGGTTETEELLPKVTDPIQPTEFSTAHNNYVNVTLDQVDNPYLTIKGTIFRDAPHSDFPDGPNVTCLTAVRGKPGFSSGQHYWEVSLWKDPTGLKLSWWVGVTNADIFSKDISPTTSNGFWFLSSSPETPESLHFNTEPIVALPANPRPKTLGVYLNYDIGELSFYNVEHESLIGSLKADFKGEVFPLFNPGKGDRTPMVLIQKEKQDEDTDLENSQLLSNNSDQKDP